MSGGPEQQAFAVFRRAVVEEPIEKQVAAMKKLPTVMLAAGAAVVKESIFPLLKEYIPGGDDEVLLALGANLDLRGNAADCAEVLGTGPDRNCWHELFEIFEMLCAVEETVVRDQAVVTVLHSLEFLSDAAASAAMGPMLSRLSTDEWFTARVSASCLLPESLRRSDNEETQNALVQVFLKLCEDDTPMVRRAIARAMADVAETVVGFGESGKEVLLQSILPQFKLLGIEDDATSVQHIVAQSAKRLAALLTAEEFTDQLLEYVRWCAESPSWRIRSITAPQFGGFCKVLASKESSATYLLPLYMGLLVDPERDVRAEACRGAVEIHAGVGHVPFVEHIVPKLARCVTDESHVVRNAYAEQCSDIIVALEEADRAASSGGEVVTDLIVKTFSLLSDDNAEVRAKVMSAIRRLTDRSDGSPENGLLEERFLNSLQAVARDADWRVRASFTMQLPALAHALDQGPFQKHFYDAYMSLIVDEVAAVRAAAVDIIVPLTDELEETWLHKVFVASLLKKIGKPGDPSRNSAEYMLFLNFAQALCANGGEDERLTQKMLPIVRDALQYKIPNVQFAACDVLVNMRETIDPENAITNIRPRIAELADSKDSDVASAARRVLEAFNWSIGKHSADSSQATGGESKSD